MEIETFDNLIPMNIQEELLALHTDNYFPWYFQSQTADYNDKFANFKDVECFQFSHGSFYNGEKLSEVFDYTKKILNYIDGAFDILRIKSNFTTNITNYKTGDHQPIHIDSNTDNVSLLYYVNDNDGGTLFFDNNNNVVKKVNAKKGRLLVFPANMKHAGFNPIKHQYKIVINYVLDKNK
tara:strand:- start:3860 stop:4399 length:540 start_codon:yes stop_codon:yes gene_type:complete